MGYYLHALICKQDDSIALSSEFDKAIEIELNQGLCLIPMTEDLFNQINHSTVSPDIGSFEYLNRNIENRLLKCFGGAHFAYVEAEYFGGEGGQAGVVWQDGKRKYLLDFGQGRINQLLQDFGVVADKGTDAFNTLGFGRHRFTANWVEEAT